MLRVLFRGWINIPHSYAVVNCFQLLNLHKYYSDQIEIYVEEMPYFKQEWVEKKQLVYGEENNKILSNLKKWAGEDVDLVYTITYPYNLNMSVKNANGELVKKCCFYTSEFAWLNNGYFCNDKSSFVSDKDVVDYINKYGDKLKFTSPSLWSSVGLSAWGIPANKNRIVMHGFEPDFFYYQNTGDKRKRVREFYKVAEDDILLLNIGAMTENKGIMLILELIHNLVHTSGKTKYKLLLKGTGDLYSSKMFLEEYFKKLCNLGTMSTNQMDDLLQNHIIFTDKTLSYSTINDLYNAADLYLSPYLAEGFNLTTLEALATGLSVAVPISGSTREYINHIYENGGKDLVFYINSQILRTENGMHQNYIQFPDFKKAILENEDKLLFNKKSRGELYNKVRSFMESNYSWKHLMGQLVEYFKTD